MTRYMSVTSVGSNILIWNSNNDKTHQLGPYEDIVFKSSRDLFFIPNHLTVILDDDLIGSRSKEIQNKLLSQRKVAKEDYAADLLCENFMSVVLHSRLRRLGESQCTNVYRLFSSVLNGRGKKSLRGMELGGDQGYGSYFLGKLLVFYGISSTFIIPQHLNKCHPFIAESMLKPDAALKLFESDENGQI